MAASHGYDGFAQRLASAFGELQQTEAVSSAAAAAWQPATEQVFRAGDAGYSSEEEEAQEEQRHRLPDDLMRDLLDMGGDDAEPFQPTGAFCRAVDKEEEYDDVDFVATGRDDTEFRPASTTQVLSGNVYEPCGGPAAAETSPPSSDVMQLESSPPNLEDFRPSPQQRPPSDRRKSGERKRVRFATYVPPHKRGDSSVADAVPSGAAAETPPADSNRQAGNAAVAAIRSRTGRVSTSTVPQHVCHPDKFDCYVLEESLLVGGGDRSNVHHRTAQVAVVATQQDSTQAAMEEDTDMPPLEADRELPAFGAGIAFRARSQADNQEQPAAAAAATQPRSSASAGAQPAPSFLQDEEIDDDGAKAQEAAAAGAAAQPAPRAARQRHYRNRPAAG